MAPGVWHASDFSGWDLDLLTLVSLMVDLRLLGQGQDESQWRIGPDWGGADSYLWTIYATTDAAAARRGRCWRAYYDTLLYLHRTRICSLTPHPGTCF